MTRKTVLKVGIGYLVLVGVAEAIPVEDLAAMPQRAQQIVHAFTLISNSLTTIARIETLTSNLKYEAQSIAGSATQWGWIEHPWRNWSTHDSTGINAGWMATVNHGVDVTGSYGRMVGTLNNDVHYYPVGVMGDAQRSVAMVERMDGHAQQSAMLIGAASVANDDYQRRLALLNASIHSADPAQQTSKARQEQAAAAAMLNIEGASIQAGLQRQMLAQDTERLIAERERQRKAINTNAYFYSNAKGGLADMAGNETDGLDALRVAP